MESEFTREYEDGKMELVRVNATGGFAIIQKLPFVPGARRRTRRPFLEKLFLLHEEFLKLDNIPHLHMSRHLFDVVRVMIKSRDNPLILN